MQQKKVTTNGFISTAPRQNPLFRFEFDTFESIIMIVST